MDKFSLSNDLYKWAYNSVQFKKSKDVTDLENLFWSVIKQVEDINILCSVFNVSEELIKIVKTQDISAISLDYSLSFYPRFITDHNRLAVIKKQIKNSRSPTLQNLSNLYWQLLNNLLACRDIDYCIIATGLEREFLEDLMAMSFIEINRFSENHVTWQLRFNQQRYIKRLAKGVLTHKFIRFIDSLEVRP